MSDPDLYRRLAALEKWHDAMAAVERSRFIGARYTTNAGQSIPNNNSTVVNYEDATYDPLSLVTVGVNWQFTCPIAGRYHIDASILFTGTTAWASGEIAQLAIYRDAGSGFALYSVVDFKDNWPAGATLFAGVHGADTISCNAGDGLQAVAYQNTGGSLAIISDALYNHISVFRIG